MLSSTFLKRKTWNIIWFSISLNLLIYTWDKNRFQRNKEIKLLLAFHFNTNDDDNIFLHRDANKYLISEDVI